MQHLYSFGSRLRRWLAVFLFLAASSSASWAFGIEDVDRLAIERASHPWVPVAQLADVPRTYDAWRDLRFRRSRALWHGAAREFEAQFFPAGGSHARPVSMSEVVEGRVVPIRITRGDFVLGDALPGEDPAPAPLVGVRLLYPLNRPDHFDEIISFIGASYFRALGAGQQYGSSARALAIDTTGGQPEEFPSFVHVWLVRPEPGATAATVYALMDGPRVAGAYRFDIRPGATTQVDVQARLHFRAGVTTLGVAPLTSMFFSGENQPVAGDFRPEVHDADGLQIALPDGEWAWRPLIRPQRPFVTSFAARGLRGFGLMQRDRRFASYEDLEAHYQRRPSVWVEPLGDWGPGRVELLQLPAAKEAEDNVVAYWVPDEAPRPGRPLALSWRLYWAGDGAPGPSGRVTQTRVGFGYRGHDAPDGLLQFHVDFAGERLSALPRDAMVSAVVSGNPHVQVLDTRVEPLPAGAGWRLTLDVARPNPQQPLELRAFLRLDAGDTLTETWAYALAPRREQP